MSFFCRLTRDLKDAQEGNETLLMLPFMFNCLSYFGEIHLKKYKFFVFYFCCQCSLVDATKENAYNRVRALFALLVQLVERRFPKPDVEGSSPSGRDFVTF